VWLSPPSPFKVSSRRAPSLSLRPADAGDEPFLMRVYASTREGELALVPWSADQKAGFVAHQFAAQAAHHERHYTGMTSQVILRGGDPVGRLLVARWAEEIRIVDITLLPRHRGAGAGSALVRELMDEAAAAGKRLSIHVERGNRALGLYERLGFRPAGEHGVYLRMVWGPGPDQLQVAS
jgi:ribosomal protein S18 acetylase RimI-like enzyme